MRNCVLAAIVVGAFGVLGCAQILGDFRLESDASVEDPGELPESGAKGDGGPADVRDGSSGACVAQSKKCDDSDPTHQSLLICAGGAWQKSATCPYCLEGRCVECTPPAGNDAGAGQTNCLDGQYTGCDKNGHWQTLDDCKPSPDHPMTVVACTSTGCMRSGCIPGETRCDGADGLTGKNIQMCDETGTWKATAACPYVCINSVCTGACVPGSQQCNGTQPQLCDAAGAWNNMGPACTGATGVCVKGTCASQCTANDKQCSDKTPQTCTNGRWISETACTSACQNGACLETCPPNRTECGKVGELLILCDANGAPASKPCPFVCRNSICSGECKPAAMRCKGSESQFCDSAGTWQDIQSCIFGCVGEGKCASFCRPGSRQCVGPKVQICDAAGDWVDGETCPNGCSNGGVCQ